MAGLGRVLALGVADLLASYALFMMITYLTDVWNLGFVQAAAVINVFWGLVSVFPLFLMFMSKSVGNRFVVVTTTIAYSIGMVLLTMSTPPVLGNALGTCTEFEPRCIGQTQRILFYIAVPLIALGMSGHKNALESFLPDQIVEGETVPNSVSQGGNARVLSYINGLGTQQLLAICGSNTEMFIAKIVAVFVLPYFKSWSVRFGVPAAFTLLVTLLFLHGLPSYKFPKPEGSTLTRFFRVFVSATSKLFYRIPENDVDLYENQDDQVHYKVPHTDSLRFLDKAAIIVPNKPLEQQQNHRWRLCTVTEVEDTKKMVRIIPVCLTLILCGVVSAIGWAFFAEQLGHMNPKVGRLTMSTGIILWFHEHTRDQVVHSSRQAAASVSASGFTSIYSLIGISISMIVAILCCIVAALVEHRRLGVVQKHGSVDGIVPMTMFWLLPQFILLGNFTGLFKSAAESFFKRRFPKAALSYLPLFVEALYGVGTLCSVAAVYLVGKVSEKGGNRNWFQESLNASRLDKYFWTLAWFMAINFALFIVAAIWYRHNQSEDIEVQDNDTEQLVQQLLL